MSMDGPPGAPPSVEPASPTPEDPLGMSMKVLFEHAGRVEASDLLLTAGSPPFVRVLGDLHPVTKQPLEAAEVRGLVWSLLNQAQRDAFQRDKELDFSLAVTPELRFRANVYYQRGTVAAAFRLIPKTIPRLDTLGLPPVIKSLTLRPNGLVLVTGPTGSGKSTTQASMIDLVNATRRCHIVTVEDPIEFIHKNQVAVIDQREVYSDTHSFANALKYVLRQDPDVILVGEMRDMETISAALTAAETGHLVIATLHTNDAIQSIDRIVDTFPPHQQSQIRAQLAFVLLAVISQQLVPHANGSGRVLAAEVLVKNHAIAAQIREGKTHQTRTAMEASRSEGMITMDWRLKELLDQGTITYEELKRRVSSPAVLEQMAQQDVARTGRVSGSGRYSR
jgi:twitching motility protein PilT